MLLATGLTVTTAKGKALQNRPLLHASKQASAEVEPESQLLRALRGACMVEGELVGLMLLHGLREEDLPRERALLAEVRLPYPEHA